MNTYDITRQPRSYRATWGMRGRFAPDTLADRFLSGVVRPGIDRAGNVSVRMWGCLNTITGKRESFVSFVSYDTPIALMSADGLRLYVSSHTYSISSTQHRSALQHWKYGFTLTGRAIWTNVNNPYAYYGAPRGTHRVEFVEYMRSAHARDRDAALFASANGFARKR
jgi:hypothetical protein